MNGDIHRSGCHSAGPMDGRGGFTLTELMVVLAIFILLTSLAAFNFLGRAPRARMDGVQEILLNALQTARMKAMAEISTAQVSVVSGEVRVWVDANRNGSLDAGEQGATNLSHTNGLTIAFNTGGSTTLGSFRPDGTFAAVLAGGQTYLAATITASGEPRTNRVIVLASGQVASY